MNLIDGLLGEHGVLCAEIDYLEGAVPEAKAIADVQASVALLAAGVQSHSRLEDELLFVSLERHLGAETGAIQSMRRMHADLDAAFERLRTVTELCVARELALNLVALAREHFSAEEELCFPLAEETLPQDQLARLGDTWAARRGLAGA